jgi:hypothetical protein
MFYCLSVIPQDPFLFYVLCEFDDRGYHPVGYFSKVRHAASPSTLSE